LTTPLFADLLPDGRGDRQRRRDTFAGLDEKAQDCSESHHRGRAMTLTIKTNHSTDEPEPRFYGVPSSLPRRVYHFPDNIIISKIAFLQIASGGSSRRYNSGVRRFCTRGRTGGLNLGWLAAPPPASPRPHVGSRFGQTGNRLKVRPTGATRLRACGRKCYWLFGLRPKESGFYSLI